MNKQLLIVVMFLSAGFLFPAEEVSLKREPIVETHNGLLVYMCPYCSQWSYTRYICKKHIENHSKEEIGVRLLEQQEEQPFDTVYFTDLPALPREVAMYIYGVASVPKLPQKQ